MSGDRRRSRWPLDRRRPRRPLDSPLSPTIHLSFLLAMVLALLIGTAAFGQTSDLRAKWMREIDRGNVEAVERALSDRSADGVASYLLGVAAESRGRLIKAESLFRRSMAKPGLERVLAEARVAEVLLLRGQGVEATRLADQLARSLEAKSDLQPLQYLALGIVRQVLGSDRPLELKRALEAYDRAVAADSSLIEAHLRLGQLFLSKYNGPDAKAAFLEADRRDPGNARAKLGLAEVGLFAGDPESSTSIDLALVAGPLVGRAHAVKARLELDAESRDSALVEARRAVALDSSDLLGWAIQAAVALAREDSAGFRTVERGVRAWHRSPAGFYAELALALGRQRRYRDAVGAARRGVEVAPNDPALLSVLGMNQLRVGAIDSGRATLERAFQRDPYHVWNKNTLDLLDDLAGYRTVATERFLFVAEPQEIDLLTLYLGPKLEAAFDSLAARYRYRPPTPVRIEIYRRHADFSVRSVGLVGLGALGVSFGSVLAMDAPSARPVGQFNWVSTAWHELVHAFTLGASNHRVPRWLSEGLSVLEERRADPSWGAKATVTYVAALKGGFLRPVKRMNEGFVAPRFAGEIPLAYYHASLFCEFLEEKFGIAAINQLLAAYRDRLETEAAFRKAVKLGSDELDTRFTAWLTTRFATALAAVPPMRDSVLILTEPRQSVEQGRELRRAGRVPEAIAVLERVDRMFPEMAGDGPAWELAEIYRDQKNPTKALEYLSRVTRLNESHYEANLREAELREQLGDWKGALAAWERAVYISPYDVQIHDKAARAATQIGNHRTALRERKAILALRPSDRVEALYQLALALRDVGDKEAAKRATLEALEIAPSFEKAQRLLLELRKEKS